MCHMSYIIFIVEIMSSFDFVNMTAKLWIIGQEIETSALISC